MLTKLPVCEMLRCRMGGVFSNAKDWMLNWVRRSPFEACLMAYGCLGLGILALTTACTTTEVVSAGYLTTFETKADYIFSPQCGICHAEQYESFNEGSVHAGLIHPGSGRMDISCESCHGPGSEHMLSGGQGNILSLRGDSQSCFKCHAEMRAQFALTNSHPVLQGQVDCADCHNPHESAVSTLEVAHNTSLGDATCLKCHAAQQGPHVFEHEAMREGCTVCHDPHGSVNERMLKIRNGVLCMQCHLSSFEDDSDRIVFGSRPHSGRYLSQGTCWSAGCHTAPHGSQVDPNLRF